MILYIIRGLPGSGKTTEAHNIIKAYPNTKHYEADMFFVNQKGEYIFDHKKIHTAHKWCLAEVENALKTNNDVIVSNTFTQNWEMKPYFVLGEKYNASIKVVVMKGEFENIHNVPSEVIARMRNRWEE